MERRKERWPKGGGMKGVPVTNGRFLEEGGRVACSNSSNKVSDAPGRCSLSLSSRPTRESTLSSSRSRGSRHVNPRVNHVHELILRIPSSLSSGVSYR